MKIFFCIPLLLFLVGCQSSFVETEKAKHKPDVKLEIIHADGYIFEVWQRSDDSKYMYYEKLDKKMEIWGVVIIN